jgi:hypothetical protein
LLIGRIGSFLLVRTPCSSRVLVVGQRLLQRVPGGIARLVNCLLGALQQSGVAVVVFRLTAFRIRVVSNVFGSVIGQILVGVLS